ncbi:MAG: phtE [Gammaproteobacteria bacterium]|jgi:sugar phosphate permease|nr:phtE [Gammaproteobacteria bacterium]
MQKNKKLQWFPWLVCMLGALFYCYEYYLRIAPSVMTADLMRAFGISAAALGNLTAFYYYAYTPMQLPVGILMDRYGPRRLLVIAVLCCAVGSYLFTQTSHIGIAQFGRFIVGFGSAFAFVGVLKLSALWLAPERFAFMSGFATTLGMLGAVVGDISLSAMVSHLGWQHTIILAASAGLVLALVIYWLIPDRHRHNQYSRKPTTTSYKELFMGLPRLMQNPQIWLNGIIGGLIYIPTTAFAELWGIPYLEQAYQYSKMDAASTISMIFLGWAVGGPLMGIISEKIRLRRLPMTIGALVAAVLITIVLYVPNLSKLEVTALLFVFGIFSSAQIIVFAIGRENSSFELSGTVVALTNLFVMLSGVIFQPLIGVMLDKHWTGTKIQGIHSYNIADFQFALSILPIGLIIACVLTLFLRETHCKLQFD